MHKENLGPSLYEVVCHLATGQQPSNGEASILIRELFEPAIRAALTSKRLQAAALGLDEADFSAELWIFSSTPDSKTAQTLWQKAIRYVEKCTDPSCQDETNRRLKGYLMLSLKRRINKILMEKSTVTAILSVIKEAVGSDGNLSFASTETGLFHSEVTHIDAKKLSDESVIRWSEREIASIQSHLTIPPPKGSRNVALDIAFPQPGQAAAIMHQILSMRGAPIPVRDLANFLLNIYKIPRDSSASSIDVPIGGEEDGKALAETLTASGANHPYEKIEMTQGTELLCERLLDEISVVDRAAIVNDDPQSGGKIGRLLLDFIIWQQMPLQGTNRLYGFEEYAKRCSTPVSTVNDRCTKKLLPILTAFCEENELDAPIFQVIVRELRQKFINRKPENVVYSDFYSE